MLCPLFVCEIKIISVLMNNQEFPETVNAKDQQYVTSLHIIAAIHT